MGGELIKMRVQIEIFKFSNLAHSRIFSKLGKLGGNLLPFFPINRRKEAVPNIPQPPWLCILAILGVKNYFREENSSRGAFVKLLRRFREQIREGFPSFFTVLHPFFVRSSFFNG